MVVAVARPYQSRAHLWVRHQPDTGRFERGEEDVREEPVRVSESGSGPTRDPRTLQ